MNAIEGFEVLLAGLGTLPVAAGIAWMALKALLTRFLETGAPMKSPGATV